MKKLILEYNEETKEWEASMDSSKPIWKSKTLLKLLRPITKYIKGQNL